MVHICRHKAYAKCVHSRTSKNLTRKFLTEFLSFKNVSFIFFFGDKLVFESMDENNKTENWLSNNNQMFKSIVAMRKWTSIISHVNGKYPRTLNVLNFSDVSPKNKGHWPVPKNLESCQL
jgi:hypothetical protein